MQKIICFHNPDEENGWLSNWYPSMFTVDGITFTSMEQYMMYKKAEVFGDEDIKKEIMSTDDVGKIKALGRQVHNYNNTVWNGMRQIIIYEGLYAKYSQDDELKEKLLKTGDRLLAECAVQDKIWATGISMKDDSRFDMNKWTGQNLLGFATMLVREKLQKRTVMRECL